MPRFSKKRFTKRRFKKRSEAKQNDVHTLAFSKVSRWNNTFGFPDKMLVRLKYNDVNSLVSTSGALDYHQFRLNSIFDTDLTGVGHQPMYHDQVQTLYNHYAVVGSKVKFIIWQLTTAMGAVVGTFTSDDGTVSTDYQTLMENSHANNSMIGVATGSNARATFHNVFSARKNLGINAYTSQTYKTAFGSNPSEETIVTIWQKPLDGGTTVTTYFSVEIEYVVLLTELKEVSQS